MGQRFCVRAFAFELRGTCSIEASALKEEGVAFYAVIGGRTYSTAKFSINLIFSLENFRNCELTQRAHRTSLADDGGRPYFGNGISYWGFYFPGQNPERRNT